MGVENLMAITEYTVAGGRWKGTYESFSAYFHPYLKYSLEETETHVIFRVLELGIYKESSNSAVEMTQGSAKSVTISVPPDFSNGRTYTVDLNDVSNVTWTKSAGYGDFLSRTQNPIPSSFSVPKESIEKTYTITYSAKKNTGAWSGNASGTITITVPPNANEIVKSFTSSSGVFGNSNNIAKARLTITPTDYVGYVMLRFKLELSYKKTASGTVNASVMYKAPLTESFTPIRTTDFDVNVTNSSDWSSGYIEYFTYDLRVIKPKSENASERTAYYGILADCFDDFVVHADITAPYVIPVCEYCDITYDFNGGDGTITSQRVYADKPYKLISERPVRDGYVFKGWGRSTSYAIDFAHEQEVTVNDTGLSPLTLYAQWEKEVTVTCYSNKPELPHPVSYIGYMHNDDESVTVDISGASTYMVLNGYRLSHFVRINGISEYSSLVTVSEDELLYARWDKQVICTYNALNGSIEGESTKVDSFYVPEENNSYTLKYECVANPGYRFDGWSVDGSIELYQKGDTVELLGRNVSIAAVLSSSWKSGEYYVKTDDGWMRGIPYVKDGTWKPCELFIKGGN